MRNAEHAETSSGLATWFRRDVEQPLENLVGGPARLKVILLLACVLALDSADKATVGAVAVELKPALGIDNVEVGWLVSASTGLSALATLPFGLLVDRLNRTRLLLVTIAVWSVTMIVSGASVSYLMLLLSRLALGGVVAAAAPAVTSLIGDYFRPGERGKIFGYVLAGELVGVAFGFLVSGNLASFTTWRASFWVLGACGLVLAWVIWKHLPEPGRGGQSRIPPGAEHVPRPADAGDAQADGRGQPRAAQGGAGGGETRIDRKVREADVDPQRERVLDTPSHQLSMWQAVRYIATMPTYRMLILSSSLGYFYFTGLRTFAIVFMRSQFHLGQAMASTLSVGLGLGAIIGVLLAGRAGDAWISHGRLSGRVLVGGIAYLAATVAFVPALLVPTLWVAAPFFFVAAAGLGGATPAVNACELDVAPSGLWGRGEGVRATFRFTLEAIAPPLFGYVASLFAGSGGSLFGGDGGGSADAGGLRMTFLVMLVALGAAGAVLLWRARKTYPRDVATAIASEKAGH